VLGHINQLCARAVAKGMDVFDVLKMACINPVMHYKLEVGTLQQGHAADFILLKDLTNFEVIQTWIDGVLVAENGSSLIETKPWHSINHFDCKPVSVGDFNYPLNKWGDDENFEQVYVMEALDGQLITNKLVKPIADFEIKDNALQSSVANDLLKLVVVNRYTQSPIAKTFVKNFGLIKGAMASSVAHDSHNIVAVGVDDESLCNAVNKLIQSTGGIAATDGSEVHMIALPVAGLMTTENGYEVAEAYTKLDNFTKQQLGSTLQSPFMTLSFMALLVIPHMKLSDKGLFDGDSFTLI
jgi:adenine deaminase